MYGEGEDDTYPAHQTLTLRTGVPYCVVMHPYIKNTSNGDGPSYR